APPERTKRQRGQRISGECPGAARLRRPRRMACARLAPAKAAPGPAGPAAAAGVLVSAAALADPLPAVSAVSAGRTSRPAGQPAGDQARVLIAVSVKSSDSSEAQQPRSEEHTSELQSR